MMRLLVLAVFVFAGTLAFDQSLEAEWEAFKQRFGKVYASETEESQRRASFESNYHYIVAHNAHAEEHGFTLAINKYSDFSVSEAKQTLNGVRPPPQEEKLVHRDDSSKMADLPASVNWVTKGFANPVEDQGQCGSCYTFSSVGAVEAAHFISTGNLVVLSEQQIVDCDDKTFGCGGGWMDDVFSYVIQAGGLDTNASYPYVAQQEQSCEFKPKDVGAKISSYVDVQTGNETALKAAVANNGPVSVAIDAAHASFFNYQSGVYYEPDCRSERTSLDHAVLVVGYDTDSQGQDYWLVKNSWGDSWGDNGYIKMSRNRNNNCGIATAASYPVV